MKGREGGMEERTNDRGKIVDRRRGGGRKQGQTFEKAGKEEEN
jgi:hypothetical protein